MLRILPQKTPSKARVKEFIPTMRHKEPKDILTVSLLDNYQLTLSLPLKSQMQSMYNGSKYSSAVAESLEGK